SDEMAERLMFNRWASGEDEAAFAFVAAAQGGVGLYDLQSLHQFGFDGRVAAQLLPDGALAVVDFFLAIPDRLFDDADVAHETDKALGLDGGRLIGAPHGAVEGDVALDHAGAHRDGGVGDLQADFVAGIADRAIEFPPQR